MPWHRGRLGSLLAGVFALSLVSIVLPDIALDTGFADGVVHLTDTATWTLMTLVSVGMVIMLVSRPGLRPRRRWIEARILVATMLIVLAGNGLLNEYVIKPVFGVPRPNIVALAEAGSLGEEIPNGDAFYAVGNKGDRRVVLAARLPNLDDPALSELVRAHWIHETGYSFPSGHATSAMTLATLMAVLGLMQLTGWRRRFTLVVLPAWAVGIVYSRPLLEVHTAADVIGGTLAGFGWGLLGVLTVRWALDRYAKE